MFGYNYYVIYSAYLGSASLQFTYSVVVVGAVNLKLAVEASVRRDLPGVVQLSGGGTA